VVFRLFVQSRATAKATRVLSDSAVELVNLRIALTVGGKAPALHILIVSIKRSLNDFERICVDSKELWLEAGIQPDQVLIDENLSTHVRAGSDADSWDV